MATTSSNAISSSKEISGVKQFGRFTTELHDTGTSMALKVGNQLWGLAEVAEPGKEVSLTLIPEANPYIENAKDVAVISMAQTMKYMIESFHVEEGHVTVRNSNTAIISLMRLAEKRRFG